MFCWHIFWAELYSSKETSYGAPKFLMFTILVFFEMFIQRYQEELRIPVWISWYPWSAHASCTLDTQYHCSQGYQTQYNCTQGYHTQYHCTSVPHTVPLYTGVPHTVPLYTGVPHTVPLHTGVLATLPLTSGNPSQALRHSRNECRTVAWRPNKSAQMLCARH